MEYFGEQVLVPSDGFSGGFQGVFALVLPQEVEADAAQQSKVIRCVFFSGATSVFSKHNIQHPMRQHPMRLIFDLPMRADGSTQEILFGWKAAQEGCSARTTPFDCSCPRFARS